MLYCAHSCSGCRKSHALSGHTAVVRLAQKSTSIDWPGSTSLTERCVCCYGCSLAASPVLLCMCWMRVSVCGVHPSQASIIGCGVHPFLYSIIVIACTSTIRGMDVKLKMGLLVLLATCSQIDMFLVTMWWASAIAAGNSNAFVPLLLCTVVCSLVNGLSATKDCRGMVV